MSDFFTRKPLPMARIVLYGFLAAVAVAALGYLQQDPKLYIFAVIAGVFIGGFGYYASWMRANVRPAPSEVYPPAGRYPAVLRLLIIVGVLASIVAAILDILHKK